MDFTPSLKKGDRLEAELVNEIIRRVAAERPGSADYNVAQPEIELPNFDRVLGRPDFSLPARSIVTPRFTAPQLELVDGIPRVHIDDVTRMCGPVYTNGDSAISSGEDGSLEPMMPGRFHWIRSTSTSIIGHCGPVGTSSGAISPDYCGFFSFGGQVIDGVNHSYVTRIIPTLLLGTASATIPITGQANVAVMSPTTTSWGGTTQTVKAFTLVTPIPSGSIVALWPVDFRWFAVRLC
jgi:hypothetical protein